MKKFCLKILIFVFICIASLSISYATSYDQADLAREYISANKESRDAALKDLFVAFKNLVSVKGSFEDIRSGWLYFDENNDKLLIGSSGAVFCGGTMQREGLQKYGYDVIAFGGVFDDELVELLKRIDGKKYKTIVLFGGINDLNLRSLYNFHDIDFYYCEVLNLFLDEAKNHLIDENSSVYYIKIKPMTLNRDMDNERFINNFNNMAKEINDNVELFGYKSYAVPFDTSSEYSEHYIHYNNPIVYDTMFKSIG